MTQDEKRASDVYERVDNAATCLVGDGAMKSRLSSAGLTLLPLLVTDFPESLQAEFKQIMYNLTADPRKQGEGAMRDTIGSFSDESAKRAAVRILRLHQHVTRLLPPDRLP
jgi:hypothetical protein